MFDLKSWKIWMWKWKSMTDHKLWTDALQIHLGKVFNILIPYANRMEFFGESEFLFKESQGVQYVYLIDAGFFIFKNISTGVKVKTISTPNILGLVQSLYPGGINSFAIQHISHGVIYRIESQLALKLIEQFQCWSSIAYVLSFQIGTMTNRKYNYSKTNSYVLIKSLLIELSNEPDDLLKKVSAEKYISERTQLGRSSIMKILSELRKGKYIDINRGKLIKINKLPEKY